MRFAVADVFFVRLAKARDAPDDTVPSLASGSHGIMDFGLGTYARLDGREAVVTEAELNALTRPASVRQNAASMPLDMGAMADAIRELGYTIASRPNIIQVDGRTIVVAVAEAAVKGHGRDVLLNAMGLV
jgi:hypothetical protein